MKTNKENHFAHKFRLLNSQECSDDINWSMSSSSGEEYSTSNKTFCDLTRRSRYTKRKRKKAANTSNLTIKVADPPPARTERKSPILRTTNVQRSPVLGSKLIELSPILVPRCSQKSPILHQKPAKVKKKLFNNHFQKSLTNHKPACGFVSSLEIAHSSDGSDSSIKENISSNVTDNASYENTRNSLRKRVKSFFDSNFASDNISQNSISDVTTPKDSLHSDEVEISSSTTEHECNSIEQLDNKNASGDKKYPDQNTKKIKYKKDGLAHRLNILLKKHNASHSLWQHEKFLADNSNFVIPKEEHIMFRVQNVNSEYGCTIVNSVNELDDQYCIIINNCYITDKIKSDSVLKIYKPYNIVNFRNCRLVLNVCKYENLILKVLRS